MPDRKSNNIIADKLDSMDKLPNNVEFNHAAVWQQLESSLQPAKKKRQLAWLYVAASLIVLLFSWFLIDHNYKTETRSIITNEGDVPKKNQLELRSKQETKNQNLEIKKNNIQQNIAEVKSFTESIAGKQKNITTTFSVVDTSTTMAESSLVNIPVELTQPVDISVAQAKPIKPKLKVMHINEMGNIVVVPEQKSETNNSLMLMFNKTALTPDLVPTEEDNTAPVRKKSIFKSAMALQDNN